MKDETSISKNIILVEDFFEDTQDVILDDRNLNLFLNGVKITENRQDGIYRIYNKNEFIGTGVIENKKLKRDIVLL